jgi:hypothetical protein
MTNLDTAAAAAGWAGSSAATWLLFSLLLQEI